jgi:hypothetical protein
MTPAQPALDAMKHARDWLGDRWSVEHPNEAHVKQLAEYGTALAAEVRAQRETIAGLEKRVEALTADAALWRGLMACQRVRTMGFTKDMNHVGMEFWREHPAKHPSAEYPQDACRERITEFARLALSGDTINAVSLALPDSVRNSTDDLEGNAGETPNG